MRLSLSVFLGIICGFGSSHSFQNMVSTGEGLAPTCPSFYMLTWVNHVNHVYYHDRRPFTAVLWTPFD